jgi:hypothetical protein
LSQICGSAELAQVHTVCTFTLALFACQPYLAFSAAPLPVPAARPSALARRDVAAPRRPRGPTPARRRGPAGPPAQPGPAGGAGCGAGARATRFYGGDWTWGGGIRKFI